MINLTAITVARPICLVVLSIGMQACVLPLPYSGDDLVLIEKELIERPVKERRGPNVLAQALNVGLVAPGFSRPWEPQEKVEELYEQNRWGFLAGALLAAR